ncbi:MAG: diguanylate cyclase [Magnetospirillum sp.]|nr:diguanylate cyclase [Magnetospirillum sp.]
MLWLACLLPAQGREVLPYCADPDWPPYETVGSDGHHVGIAADLLTLVAARSGLELQLVPTATWQESLKAAGDGRCQALSFLNSSPARQEWLVFTDPLFADPNVILTREESPDIGDLAVLDGKVLALPEGTSIEEWVRRDYPNLRVVTTKDEDAAFAMVSNRQADLTLRSMTVAVHAIKRRGWFNLKVAGRVEGYDNLLRMGVRPERAALVPALNQGIAAISTAERTAIANRHTGVTVRTGIDPDVVRNGGAVLAVVLLTSLFWGLKLKAVNAKLRHQTRTDNLTGLGNRSLLNDRLELELARAARMATPLSVVLMDVDHFKQVNDRFGHLVGDEVLKSMAAILRREARQTDTAGRWGGEEFLILCPDTSLDHAMVLAERIRQGIAQHAFTTGARHSASFGLAQWRGGETADSLLARADMALYRAKENGRDRVELA